MATSSSAPHILVFPYPGQGHMIPLLDLSLLLASRGLSLTVVVTPNNLPTLEPILHSASSTNIQPLVLPFPKTLPSSGYDSDSLPDGVENVKDLPPAAFRPMMIAMSQLYHPIASWFRSHPSPPVAILSDFFLGFTHRLAADLGVKRLVFFPSGVKASAIINSLWRNMPSVDGDVSFPDIPGSPSFPSGQISTVYRSYREGDPVSEFIKNGMRANSDGWGVIFNSFSELEERYLAYMRADLGHGRVWAVGPLISAVGSAVRGGASSVPVSDVSVWLDSRADSSVVYVCFGTQAVLNPLQIAAVAEALDRSGTHFVWRMKGSTGATEEEEEKGQGVLPDGFEERTAGRGLIINGWAPQVAVLRHCSLGSFLSHCGWNSTMEALAAGVPVLAWPMGADQFTNAGLLVEELGAGVRVCEGADAVPDPDVLARTLAQSVTSAGGSRWEAIRARAEQLKEMAAAAVAEGGSSSKKIDGLVEGLSKLSAASKTMPEMIINNSCAPGPPSDNNLQSIEIGR